MVSHRRGATIACTRSRKQQAKALAASEARPGRLPSSRAFCSLGFANNQAATPARRAACYRRLEPRQGRAQRIETRGVGKLVVFDGATDCRIVGRRGCGSGKSGVDASDGRRCTFKRALKSLFATPVGVHLLGGEVLFDLVNVCCFAVAAASVQIYYGTLGPTTFELRLDGVCLPSAYREA